MRGGRRIALVKRGDELVVTDKQVKGCRVLASAVALAVSIEVGGSRFRLGLTKKKEEKDGHTD